MQISFHGDSLRNRPLAYLTLSFSVGYSRAGHASQVHDGGRSPDFVPRSGNLFSLLFNCPHFAAPSDQRIDLCRAHAFSQNFTFLMSATAAANYICSSKPRLPAVSWSTPRGGVAILR